MTKPTPEQLERLPAWARSHIATLERQRETAIRALNEYCDSQTESPVRIPEYESTGEEVGPSRKMRFVQTHKLEIDWQGVRLAIFLRDDSIELRWGGSGRTMSECAFIPHSFQAANLKAKGSLR